MDPERDQQLVKLARRLERLMAQRRKRVAALSAVDDEIREARKFLRDLTTPDPTEVYAPRTEAVDGPA